MARLLDLQPAIVTIGSGTIDPSTADGRMFATILAGVDAAERERVAERVSRKRSELVADGRWTGGYRPFGYAVKDGRLVPDPTEVKSLRVAAEAILAGTSMGGVVRAWGKAGVTTTEGNPWNTSHLKATLRRDLPGILSKSDTKRLRTLFDSRSVESRDRKLLTGLLHCGICGSLLSSRPQNGQPRYICANGPEGQRVHLSVTAGPLELAILKAAAARPAPKLSGLQDPAAPLVAEREALAARLAELAESDMPDDYLEPRVRKLAKELARIDAELETGVGGQSITFGAWLKAGGERAALEAKVERVTLAPASGHGNRFDPERVSVEWRDGVEPS